MILLYPIWLLLLLPLAAALWLWPMPSRLLLGLRLTVLVLIVLALCGPALELPSRAGTVVVVADRSLSMPPGSDTAHKEAIDLLQSGMAGNDRLAIVAFGQRAAIEPAPEGGKFPGFAHEVGRDASNLADAVDTALALIPSDAIGRILVLSDGRWTGRNPLAASSRLAARGVPLDYRRLERPSASDVAISRLDVPPSLAPGESFLITAWVHSPVQQEVSFDLRRGGQSLAAGKRTLASGLNRLFFRDQAAEPGTLQYALSVQGSGDDPVPENNNARILIGVQGPRPIRVVPSAPASSLPRLLAAGGLKVQSVQPEECTWTLEELSGFSAIVLENTPAEKLGLRGMQTLAAWVQQTGSGLMMTGGRASYGPGGYYGSPLEPVLPVSMELRNEHRKLSLAIVVALDRSGSMAVPVSGGKVKMDLANLGTVQVLDLLGPMDELGVIAVDSAPHVIRELGPVKEKEAARSQILRIESMGGGIFIYEALAASAKMLLNAKAGTRHIILFADAADSEEPGKYQELLANCRKANITVSVIGLGKPTDQDADLLRDIARRGEGRIYFTDSPEELPRLFAQDTFVVARNTFLDEPAAVAATPGLQALAGKPFQFTQPLGGYNLCYIRPGANLAAVTLDEYKAPVVAAWQAGVGRVLCYTGEADGEFTGAIARWKDVGDFFTSLARWTAGQTDLLPGNMLVTQEVRNGIAQVQIHLDPERRADPFTSPPRVSALKAPIGQQPVAERVTLAWTSPDTLGVELPLTGGETALVTVDVPGHGPIPLPPVCLPYSPEFRPVESGTGQATLERLARATGGQERIDLAGIWKDIPRQARYLEIASWLLTAAIVLLLLEVFERRTGLLGARRWLPRKRPAAAQPSPLSRAAGVAPPVTRPPAQAPAASTTTKAAAKTPSPGAGGLLEAIRQARERTRGK